jgi:putative ABC transport system ATP-binding protein
MSSRTTCAGKQSIEVLHNLNFNVVEGDFAALMGPSGSGKTTLLNLIGGLDRPSRGEIDGSPLFV